MVPTDTENRIANLGGKAMRSVEASLPSIKETRDLGGFYLGISAHNLATRFLKEAGARLCVFFTNLIV